MCLSSCAAKFSCSVLYARVCVCVYCSLRFGGLGPKHERHPRTILLDIYISCPATEPNEHNPITILLGRPSKKENWKKTRKMVSTVGSTGMIKDFSQQSHKSGMITFSSSQCFRGPGWTIPTSRERPAYIVSYINPHICPISINIFLLKSFKI